MAGTARPSFDTDSSEHGYSDSDQERKRSKVSVKTLVDVPSNSDTLGSSDLDTDFSADEAPVIPVVASKVIKTPKTNSKSVTKQQSSKPALKLKIKLPPQPDKRKVAPQQPVASTGERHKTVKRRRSSGGDETSQDEKDSKDSRDSKDYKDSRPISKKMRESLALNSRARLPTSGSDEEQEEGLEAEVTSTPPVPPVNTKLYCYCQCPHDEVSEMIGCDAPDCLLEWFHFECVGILVPPEGKWFCPQCTKRYGL